MKTIPITTTLLLAVFAVVACSTGGEVDTVEPTAVPTAPPAAAAQAPTAAPEPDPEPTVRPDMEKLNYGPKSAEGFQAILGTGDLGVGGNRFGFVMTSQTGFVTEPSVKLTTRFVPDQGEESDVGIEGCTRGSWTSTGQGSGGSRSRWPGRTVRQRSRSWSSR